VSSARGHTPQLWGFAASETWRRVQRQTQQAFVFRWRFSGRTPERVLIAPPDLRIADPQIAMEIYHGRFPFAGYLVDTEGVSPFLLDVEHPAWVGSLHGFRWLRHMRAAGSELASSNARALVGDWIALHGRRISGMAWDPAIAARRIISWLQHSGVVLKGAEYRFYRAFLKSLAVQVRYLRAVVGRMPPGEEKLRARVALAFSALSLPAPPSALRSATRALSLEIERQIHPDGGHVSRNPEAVLELLADLLPLRQTYSNQAEAPPEALIGAVERMLPALRFFRHADGTLARFNGMGPTSHDRISAILHHDDTGGRPLAQAPYSGYQRLALGDTIVIADTGTPPPAAQSHVAHAGCLSFEMSSGRTHWIVNCGVDSFGADDFRPLARATAAHSTATLNETSSARFSFPQRFAELIGTPLVDGPRKVDCARQDGAGYQSFVASHDAYVGAFGLLHEREIALLAGGEMLEGADRFFREGGMPARANARDAVCVRFHLHPDVQIYSDESEALVLADQAGESWRFSCEEIAPVVEESLFFAGLGGPRRSRQITLSFRASDYPQIHWKLQRR
jgi:uncharacterized heparinase superfamily protein